VKVKGEFKCQEEQEADQEELAAGIPCPAAEIEVHPVAGEQWAVLPGAVQAQAAEVRLVMGGVFHGGMREE